MNVNEKNARIWRRDIQTKDGREFYKYTVGISSKKQDGSFTRAYLDIKFSKKAGAPSKIENGAKCDFEGFMTVESYTDKDGKEHSRPVIMVMKANFEDLQDNDPADMGGGFEQVDEPMPF